MATKRTTSFTPGEGTRFTMGKNMTVPFNELIDPGAYYDHLTGWLYRVPDEGLSAGHSPVMNIVSGEEHYVSKISDDPWIPLNKAREICSNRDFAVNF